MPGEDSQTTQQTQQSKSEPWDAAQPLLTSLIGKYKGLNTDVTSAQKSALDNLSQSTSALPNFNEQSTGAVGNFFNASTAPQVGMLTDALGKLQGNLGATASGAELNPYNTPGFSDALNTMTNDITKSVKGVYAGSGRDPSGAGSFAGTLGRGLTEGISPVLAAQFNQNKQNQMSAANTLFGAAGNTASNITGQQGTELGYGSQGLGLLPQLMSSYTAPAAAQVGAANAAYSQPFQNLLQLLQPATAMGALGGQMTGTGSSTTTQPQSTMGNIIGGVSSAASILSLLSDERAKDDIEEIGSTHDNQPIYRYRYKNSPVTQIGLLAQEVQKRTPEAVSEMAPGLLGVNYKRATERAAALGKAA